MTIARWNESGPTPRGTRLALLTVAEAVLRSAQGAVRDEDLARVIEQRFELLRPPVFVSLSSDERWTEPAAPAEDQPDMMVVAADVDARAEELWACLSQAERSLLPHLGKRANDLAEVLGTGPKTAQAVADALLERLRVAAEDDDQACDVLALLLQRCVDRP